MITRVVIFNEETRQGRNNFGDTEKIELTGNQFAYIVREEMDFGRLFNYLNAISEWESE